MFSRIFVDALHTRVIRQTFDILADFRVEWMKRCSAVRITFRRAPNGFQFLSVGIKSVNIRHVTQHLCAYTHARMFVLSTTTMTFYVCGLFYVGTTEFKNWCGRKIVVESQMSDVCRAGVFNAFEIRRASSEYSEMCLDV